MKDVSQSSELEWDFWPPPRYSCHGNPLTLSIVIHNHITKSLFYSKSLCFPHTIFYGLCTPSTSHDRSRLFRTEKKKNSGNDA